MAKSSRSKAQRLASRANGRKSRGPRTAAGKARSSRNALKHGLRAASLAILPDALGEPARLLARAVQERLAPSDVIELELTEGIAGALWRLRRAREIEDALLEGRPDTAGSELPATALLRRSNSVDALTLLLRYRNQALGELVRLRRLLGEHRQSAAAEGADPAPTPGSAAGTWRPDEPRPANDNQCADAGEPLAGEPSGSAPEPGATS